MNTKTVNIYIANTVRAKGRLNELCWWRGRRKPRNKNGYEVMSGWVNAEKQIDIWKPLEII